MKIKLSKAQWQHIGKKAGWTVAQSSAVLNLSDALNFAKGVGFDLSKIPQEVINSISKDYFHSYLFAEGLNFDSSKIPKEIISSISKNPKYSYYFARKLQFDLSIIPKEIMNSISGDSEYSSMFSRARSA